MIQLLLSPIRAVVEGTGRLLARLGLIDAGRARRVSDLVWPRVVTGVARMSKSTADVAMVGTALGASAIAGVGFALPYWALAFMLGGGSAGGTISLVSRQVGAGRGEDVSVAVKVSAVFGLAVTGAAGRALLEDSGGSRRFGRLGRGGRRGLRRALPGVLSG